MENAKFDFKEVEGWWPVCFNEACRAGEQCMRRFAATQAPDSLAKTVCVTPLAKGYGEQCELFAEKKVLRMAYGFSHLYDNVLKRDDTSIRQSLVNYFHGKRQYYWYLHGERPLTPDQQAWIQRLMERFGYTEKVVFDRFEPRYVI